MNSSRVLTIMKKPLALPHNSSPPPGIKAELLDFSTMHSAIAKSYPNHFALVIDNCFTPEECEQLISIAETDPSKWQIAQVNVGGGRQMTALDIRNSKRIIRDDYDMASFLLDRVKPFLDEVTTITRESGKWKNMMTVIRNPQKAKKFKDEEWEMTRINERMRFLKYGPGEFFEPHVDGCFTTLQVRPHEPEERTHLTFQAYLRASPDLKGGATRFFAWTGGYQHYYDVEPIPGRVLIFQHRDLMHSGDVVSQGEKITLRSDILYKRVK